MTLHARLRRRDDEGIAMLAVILMVAVLSLLIATASAVITNNSNNAGHDRQSLGALSSGEAGVAQAIQYLRGTTLAQLTCAEPGTSSACTSSSNPWVNSASPKQVRIDGGSGNCVTSSDCFKVWIGVVTPYNPNCGTRLANPPSPCYGTYRIHSTGVAGSGPGARRFAVDVKMRPLDYPLGVFSETNFSGNGNVGIHSESLFTGGCISNRQDDSHSGSGFQFQYDSAAQRPIMDLFYGIPAAAHAVGDISTSNTSCGAQGQAGPIHASAACNTTFPFDQSGGASAGNISSTNCGKDPITGVRYESTSKFTMTDLQSLYGYRPRGLTDAQYDQLRTTAQAEGTYNLAPSAVSAALTSLAASGVTSPVLYWDNGDVSLTASNFPSTFLRDLDTNSGCTSNNVTIVVSGGSNNLSYTGGNNGPWLSAAIFVPDGKYTGQGGRNTIGTIFAHIIDLGGNPDFYMDQCFASNPPGATVEVKVVNWREDDGTNIN
jgi:hypothetical protein